MTKANMAPNSSNNWFADKYHRFHNGHERVKNAVHSYWRQNTILSPKGTFGKVFMGCFYFSLPVAFAYVVVNKLADGAESNARERLSASGVTETPGSQKVETGGWGLGVNLATSDLKTHEMNRINLERFLKKQRKLKEKQEREAAAAAAAAAAAN